jgi:uncharacterized membrane protein (UPF0127 family)
MAWLLRDGEVLASVEVAESLGARARGLLGRSTLEGAMLLRPARSVHSIGMRFAIDIAFCDDGLVVLDTRTLARNRMTLPRWRARCVVEARAGAFERWRLRPGDQLELKG